MPQLVPVALTDNDGTAYTFVPQSSPQNGVSVLTSSVGVPIGDHRMTVGLIRAASGRVKPSIKLALPVLKSETVAGVTTNTVLRTAYAEITFNFDATSTLQERKDAKGLLYNCLAEPTLQTVIEKLEGMY